MKERWILTGALALVVSLAMVVGLTQAQGPGPGGNIQPQGPVSPQELTLENQQLGFVPASGAGVGPGGGSAKQPADDVPGVEPSGLINYQGRLLQNGSPYDGSINITFRLYTVALGGAAWWQETQNVQVDDGLFNVMLGAVVPLDDEAVSFQSQQWLGVQPAGAASELTPRQPLGAVAYAMNLMPGATMVDTNVGGPYGYSFWVHGYNHPAMYARSDSSTGIYASSTADNAQGVYGSASGDGNQSHGVDARMAGATGACSVGDTECGSGLYATASGDAYASWFYGDIRSGIIDIQGDNTFYGLWVYSSRSPDGYGIWTNGESGFEDYVTFTGGKSGYVVDIALNDGEEPLEKGDIVVISGYDAPVVGNIPVVRVRKATEANATGVIGVVDVLYVPCEAQDSLEAGQACGGFQPDITTIQPGEYLSVVTLGAYDAVKVDATSGSIRPGDLLATSTSTGYAMKAPTLKAQGVSFHAPGTIIGKALGALDKGTGVIPVFVSSR